MFALALVNVDADPQGPPPTPAPRRSTSRPTSTADPNALGRARSHRRRPVHARSSHPTTLALVNVDTTSASAEVTPNRETPVGHWTLQFRDDLDLGGVRSVFISTL